MKKIYKYPLYVANSQVIMMPRGAKILTAHEQLGLICLWAIVDTQEKLEARNIVVHGTGQELYDGILDYIASAYIDEFVWHIFEHRVE